MEEDLVRAEELKKSHSGFPKVNHVPFWVDMSGCSEGICVHVCEKGKSGWEICGESDGPRGESWVTLTKFA